MWFSFALTVRKDFTNTFVGKKNFLSLNLAWQINFTSPYHVCMQYFAKVLFITSMEFVVSESVKERNDLGQAMLLNREECYFSVSLK